MPVSTITQVDVNEHRLTDPALATWRARWFFRCVLPAIWLGAVLLSWKYPGDEFLLFTLTAGLPGAWITLLLGPINPSEGLPILIAAGLATIFLAGWLMDGLRVWKSIWLFLFTGGAILLVLGMLSDFPTYERAVAKNGSLFAYLAAATNLSLYLASLLCIGGAGLAHLVAYARRQLRGW